MHLHGIVAKKFAVCLTHDVDRVKKSYQYLAHFAKTLRYYHLLSFFLKEEPYWHFEKIMEIEEKYEISGEVQMKKPNLLVITDRFPHNKDPVTSSFVYSQTDALKEYFKRIYVISLNPFIPKLFSWFSFMHPRWQKDAFAEDYNYDNVEVRFVKYFMLPFDFLRKRKGKFAYKVAKKIIVREKIEFDLVHAHFTWPSGYVGAKLKEKRGKPLIITGHGHDVYDLPFKDAKWNAKIRSILNKADHIITVSKSNYSKLIQLEISKDKISIIPNGYDLNLFKPASTHASRDKVGLPVDKKIVLSVGNLETVKGHEYLIKAMKKVIQKEKDILCLIVGSGSQRNKLERLVKELDLQDDVMLLGSKPHDEIPLWINACDVFVLPSLNEGNPTVMFECLGCGKPFVGTTVGGEPEIIINEKFGVLVEPGNSEQLIDAILKALNKEWNKEHILNYAKQFTWEEIAEKIMVVYEVVCKNVRA